MIVFRQKTVLDRHAVSLARTALVLATLVVAAQCGRQPQRDRNHTPETAAAFEIDGLSAPVTVVRDRIGVPHIYAQSRDDLFAAQGFVQAQDRLFQMDLWRRSVQGRLSEVLGANFIERDAMTRRMQYRGDRSAEWESYGPDARPIAEAFVRGVNAWVAIARQRLPESFVLAGWSPDWWSADDLLNRTDAFLAGGDALDDVRRKGMSEVVADAIRRVGARPFFSLLTRSVRLQPDRDRVRLKADTTYETTRDRELVSPAAFAPVGPAYADGRDGMLAVAESARRYEHPSSRYLVHLQAPGWNVAGATAPWRPGVAIGHNDRLAWGMIPVPDDSQDVREIPDDAAATRIVKDSILVKGRREPFEFETEITPAGVVIASDRERKMKFVLEWRGFEPGWAPELASLAIDVARTPDDIAAAASRWRAPAGRLVWIARDEGEPQNTSPADMTAQGPTPSRAMFAHPLGITAAARERFSVGPVARPRNDQPFRAVFDSRRWDDSKAIVAPGQSESPDSPHFADLVRLWSSGGMAPLLFSDEAVRANAEATLTLTRRTEPRTRNPEPRTEP